MTTIPWFSWSEFSSAIYVNASKWFERNEIYWNTKLHTLNSAKESDRIALCNVDICARSPYSHTHFMTIRLIEQNINDLFCLKLCTCVWDTEYFLITLYFFVCVIIVKSAVSFFFIFAARLNVTVCREKMATPLWVIITLYCYRSIIWLLIVRTYLEFRNVHYASLLLVFNTRIRFHKIWLLFCQ